jgi:hypothetical protein
MDQLASAEIVERFLEFLYVEGEDVALRQSMS